VSLNKYQFSVVASTLLAGASAAAAHQFDPGGKITLACTTTHAPHMADVARAIEDSHYWASQNTRREILVLARQACADGVARRLTFVPPPDQRFAARMNVQVTSQ